MRACVLCICVYHNLTLYNIVNNTMLYYMTLHAHVKDYLFLNSSLIQSVVLLYNFLL